VAADDGDLDTFRLAVCAAADWVRCKDGLTGGRLVAALAGFSASWSRRDITASKIDAIAKSLRPGGRSARPLRDYFASADLSDIHNFADGMLTAMQEDKTLKAQAEALRRHGLPSFRRIGGIQDNMFDGYRRSRATCGFGGDHHSRARTSMLTMYRAKGREFDYAIMIVDPRAHTVRAAIDELRRLHYVAATRARKGLAVVYVTGQAGPVLAPVLGVPVADVTSSDDHE
jgi:UvrD-like helicase family protein